MTDQNIDNSFTIGSQLSTILALPTFLKIIIPIWTISSISCFKPLRLSIYDIIKFKYQVKCTKIDKLVPGRCSNNSFCATIFYYTISERQGLQLFIARLTCQVS